MSLEARRDVFQAIADPTRRQIINLIAQKPMNLNAIADNFEISRPAISKHIKILTECGMVVIEQVGRERFCEARLDTLSEVFNWVDQYRQFWNAKFNSLDKYLNKVQSNNKLNKMTNQTDKKEGLKIVREFKAPRMLVFQAFSTAEAFAEWWGPVGMPITIKHFEFKKGGRLLYKTEGGGQIMWGQFKYGNIVSPELIEFVNSFSDEDGNVCKPPFPMAFPLEISNQITLRENNGITVLTLESHPLNATPEQEATFYSMTNNLSAGFAGTFNQLEAYLTEKQK